MDATIRNADSTAAVTVETAGSKYGIAVHAKDPFGGPNEAATGFFSREELEAIRDAINAALAN